MIKVFIHSFHPSKHLTGTRLGKSTTYCILTTYRKNDEPFTTRSIVHSSRKHEWLRECI